MPKIKMTVPHALGKEEAKRRIIDLIANARTRIGDAVSNLEQSWNGDVETFRFRAMGFAVAGQLSVEPAAVQVEMDVPLAALVFKGRVEKEIRCQAATLLA